jgi:hypothetical protein
MRSNRRLDTAAFTLLLVIAAPPALATGLSLPRLLPSAGVGAMFEIERKSPAGPSGAAASEDARPAAVRGADIEADEGRVGDDDALAPARTKPAAERAPRWKSLIPGALK